jgi:hypothetical protein
VTKLTVASRNLANAPNNAAASVVASKETGLEVCVGKTKYVVMSDTSMQDKITNKDR